VGTNHEDQIILFLVHLVDRRHSINGDVNLAPEHLQELARELPAHGIVFDEEHSRRDGPSWDVRRSSIRILGFGGGERRGVGMLDVELRQLRLLLSLVLLLLLLLLLLSLSLRRLLLLLLVLLLLRLSMSLLSLLLLLLLVVRLLLLVVLLLLLLLLLLVVGLLLVVLRRWVLMDRRPPRVSWMWLLLLHPTLQRWSIPRVPRIVTRRTPSSERRLARTTLSLYTPTRTPLPASHIATHSATAEVEMAESRWWERYRGEGAVRE
jgi:hypothetical protein